MANLQVHVNTCVKNCLLLIFMFKKIQYTQMIATTIAIARLRKRLRMLQGWLSSNINAVLK